MPSVRTSRLQNRVTVPPALAVEVRRPGLFERLDRASEHRLTLVSAGPGWGKTTTVAAWVRDRQARGMGQAAWMSLRPGDDRAVEFWELFVEAARACGAVPVGHPLLDLSPAGGVTDEFMLALFRSLDELPEPILLVIDDFHLIESEAVLTSLGDLVELDLPVRIVLITRFDPPLPLHRHRVTGVLAEVGARDLAFDEDEVLQLATSVESLDLSEEQVASIVDRTEGWPVGVRLATMHLTRKGTDPSLAGFGGFDRSVGEYLTAEILARHTPDMQRFLQRTSVADALTGPLADAIDPGGNALARLAELERANQFVVPADSEHTTYRYHPLLRDLLLFTLMRSDPQEYRLANRAAAVWLLAHGDPIRAMEHAIDAEEWAVAADAFMAASPALVGIRRTAVRDLLERFPFATLQGSASLDVCAAGLQFASGNLLAIDRHVAEARRKIAAGDVLSPLAMATLENLACVAARTAGDEDGALKASTAAVSYAVKADPGPGTEGVRLIATALTAAALVRAGDPAEARTRIDAVMGERSRSDVPMIALHATAHRAWCDLAEGRLESAREAGLAAVAEAGRRGWTSLLQMRTAYAALAVVGDLQDECDEAERMIAAGQAAVVGGVDGWPTVALHLVQASVAVSRRRPQAAVTALEAAAGVVGGRAFAPSQNDTVLRLEAEVAILAEDSEWVRHLAAARHASPTGRAAAARCALAGGDLAEATRLALTVPRPPQRDSLDDTIAAVEADLVIADAEHQEGRAPQAVVALTRALATARPERLVRPFVVHPPDRVAVVLGLLPSTPDDSFLSAVRSGVLARCESPAIMREPEPLVEPLTERELAMLASLPSMSSNVELAAEFYVSVNTVKSHLKNLYRKLDVPSRREAVRRGRELGLIS